MSVTTRLARHARRFDPDRETVVAFALLLNTEFLLAVGYAAATGTSLAFDWLHLHAYVYLTVGLFVFWRAAVPEATGRRRLAAAGVAVGYFLLLLWANGLVNAGSPATTGLRVSLDLPFGWGPALLYDGAYVAFVLHPASLAGYGALAYLVYGTVVDASRAALGGVVGLFSCVSCTWPILAALVGGASGSTALAVVSQTRSYALSVGVFLFTVGVLYVLPSR